MDLDFLQSSLDFLQLGLGIPSARFGIPSARLGIRSGPALGGPTPAPPFGPSGSEATASRTASGPRRSSRSGVTLLRRFACYPLKRAVDIVAPGEHSKGLVAVLQSDDDHFREHVAAIAEPHVDQDPRRLAWRI